MSRGRKSKVLLPDAIRRLEEFRIARRYTYPRLKLAMNAPFKWSTLKSAMDGNPVWEMNHAFIMEWLDLHCPRVAVPDMKARAAGDVEFEPEAEHTRLRSE